MNPGSEMQMPSFFTAIKKGFSDIFHAPKNYYIRKTKSLRKKALIEPKALTLYEISIITKGMSNLNLMPFDYKFQNKARQQKNKYLLGSIVPAVLISMIHLFFKEFHQLRKEFKIGVIGGTAVSVYGIFVYRSIGKWIESQRQYIIQNIHKIDQI